jgi:integrase
LRLEESGAAPLRKDAPRNSRKKRPRFGLVREVAEAWASARKDKLYRQVAAYLIRAAGDLEPRQLTTFIPLAIQAEWRKRLSRNTLHTYTCQLRSLLRAMHEHGAPKIEIPRVAGTRAREVIATQQEIDAMLAIAPPYLRLFILLCWQTALRFSETFTLTPRSFNKETGTAAIRAKGGKLRTIPLTEGIVELIRPTLHGDPDQSCIAILRGSRCSPGAIRSQWYKLTKKLGLTHLNPHDLRRTTATALYRGSGHDLRAVQQYLGHDRMTSTLRYLAPLEGEEIRRLQALLSFHSEVKQ